MILQCKTDDFFFDGKKENEWNYWNRGNLQVQWRGCILCDLYFTERTAGMRQRIIILRGIVEGIGMRPALYRFSVEHGLRGYVCNLSGFVKLLWQGDASRIEQAFAELGSAFPDGSRVEFPPAFTDSEADCII